MGQNKKRIGLGTKTNGVFCAIGAIFVLTCACSYYGMTKLYSSFLDLNNEEIAVRDTMRVTYSDMLTLRRYEKDFINRGDGKYFESHTKHYEETVKNIKTVNSLDLDFKDDLKIDQLLKDLEGYKNTFKEYYQNSLLIGDSDAGYWHEAKVIGENVGNLTEKSAPDVFTSIQSMRTVAIYYLLSGTDNFKTQLLEKFKATENTIQKMSDTRLRQKVWNEFKAYENTFEKIFNAKEILIKSEKEMRQYVHSFEEQTKKNIQLSIDRAQSETTTLGVTNNETKTFILAISLGAIALVVFFSFYFSRAIKKIIALSLELQKASEATEKSGLDVGSTSQRVSASVTQQASAIQETVSTLNELTAMVNKSVESARKSTEKANSGHQIARTGKESVDQMISAMNQINSGNREVMDQMTNSNKEIGNIIQVINEISEKTNVINDIVFQTKLLSFNASVEAARAGEHGKGFAVVAEEVGNLAQMSGAASKEIDELLKDSIKRVEDIVSRTQSSVETLMQSTSAKIENGVNVAKKCGESLDQVVLNVEDVKRMMDEISGASQEQAEGINNITTAMNELDEATHSNSAVASETENCAKTLQEQADSLGRVVYTLREELLGSTTPMSHEIQVSASKKKVATPAKKKVQTSSQGNVKSLFDQAPKKEKVTVEAKVSLSSNQIPTEEDPRFKEVI